MEYIKDDARKELMCEFHNQIVTAMDETPLSAPEVMTILRMILANTERLFEVAVKSPARTEEKSDGN